MPDLEEKLMLAQDWALPVVAASRLEYSDSRHDERGVYYMHAYTVRYDPKTHQVIVRNPWGPMKDAEPSDSNGFALDGVNDGSFKMSIADFKKSFPQVWIAVP